MHRIGAALFTWAWEPVGNTGGMNIGAFQRMLIPPEQQRIIND
ncbi:MAG: DUF3703 domain-containing protein [Steroidobacteraceae bacterium]